MTSGLKMIQPELFILTCLCVTCIWCQCVPTDVEMLNFEKSPKRSVPFALRVSATKCPGEEKFYYNWEIRGGFDPTVIRSSSEPFLLIDGYTFPSDTVFVHQYTITVNVSHHPDLTLQGSAVNQILFSADSMHLEIKGGTERSHYSSTDLIVDAAQLSTDASFPPNENPFHNNTIEWSIEPNVPNVPTNSLTLTIPKDFLQAGQVYTFTLKMTRKSLANFPEVQSTSQIVKIIVETSEMGLKCVRNCEYPNPHEPTLIIANSMGQPTKAMFEWKITPYTTIGRYDFGTGYHQILVHPDTFKPGTDVTFTATNPIIEMYYSLVYMKMRKGACGINPDEGLSGDTAFHIHCAGFFSTRGIMRYLVYQRNEEKGEDLLLVKTKSLDEVEIRLSEGTPATVIVRVQDYGFMQEEVVLMVNVYKCPTLKTLKDIKALVLFRNNLRGISLVRLKDRNAIVQTISYVLDALDRLTVEEFVTKDLHMHMIEFLRSVIQTPPLTFTSAVQMLGILMKLENRRIKSDTETARILSRILIATVSALRLVKEDRSLIPLPEGFLNEAVHKVFDFSSMLRQVDDLIPILSVKVEPHYYDSYDEMASEKLNLRDDLREISQNVILSMQMAVRNLMELHVPQQMSTVIERDMVTFLAQRIELMYLGGQKLNIPGASTSFIFLSVPLVDELKKHYLYLDYEVIVFESNPFWWHENAPVLNTDFIVFNLFHNREQIKKLAHPVEVHLAITNISIGWLGGAIDFEYNKIAVHRVTVPLGAKTAIIFDTSTDPFRATVSDCHCEGDEFAKGIIVQPNSPPEERTLELRSVKDKEDLFVCITADSDLHYRGRLLTFKCVYWNVTKENWKSDGCYTQNIPAVESEKLICECNHLTFFAGELLVPPNKLNLDNRVGFRLILVKNWLMVAFVSTILVIWLFLLILAWQRDRNLTKSNFICRLDDNVPGDCHVYLVVVFTGIFIDAGTTADVAFQVIGSKSWSRVHLIKSANVKLLQRDAQDWFVFYTPRYLGKIKKIRLWHNCKGNKPHWYCKRIIIQDVKTGVQTCFIVEKWFSLVWGTGHIYREIKPHTEKFLPSKKTLIFVKFESYFKDKHLWLSVFTREPQSNFTCVERVSCAVAIFFLSILAGAMFFGIPTGTVTDSIDDHPTYYVTYKELIILVESLLVSAPLGALLILLFRNSAPE